MVVLDIALEMFVIVLSLVLGAVAVFYGTGGAVVVAGKARQALAVVFPFWAFALAPFYVVGGADTGTLAAMYAALRVYTKLAVAYNPFDESVADQAAVDSRPVSSGYLEYSAVLVDNVVDECAYHVVGMRFLLDFLLLFVYIHEGQAYIRFGHDKRYGTVGLQSDGSQVFLEYVYGFAYGVAGCAYYIAVASLGVGDAQIGYKLSHHEWRSPSMYGKEESD